MGHHNKRQRSDNTVDAAVKCVTGDRTVGRGWQVKPLGVSTITRALQPGGTLQMLAALVIDRFTSSIGTTDFAAGGPPGGGDGVCP